MTFLYLNYGRKQTVVSLNHREWSGWLFCSKSQISSPCWIASKQAVGSEVEKLKTLKRTWKEDTRGETEGEMGSSPACRRVAWEAKAFVWGDCAASVCKHRTGLAGLCSLRIDKRIWSGEGWMGRWGREAGLCCSVSWVSRVRHSQRLGNHLSVDWETEKSQRPSRPLWSFLFSFSVETFKVFTPKTNLPFSSH